MRFMDKFKAAAQQAQDAATAAGGVVYRKRAAA